MGGTGKPGPPKGEPRVIERGPSRMADKVLIVEDDKDVVDLVIEALRREGYEALVAETGAEALTIQRDHHPGLVILDLSLPDIDGFDVCRRLRQSSPVPIIMLTARTDLVDKVVGLEVGADDYVTKPFGVRELTARVRAQLRRAGDYAKPKSTAKVLDFGQLVIDRGKHEVLVRGEARHLTRKEFDLLHTLASNEGRVMRSADLLKQVWGYDDDIQSRTLDVHIGRVRAKIEENSRRPRMIITVPCVGYKFQAPLRAA